jgi:phenylacetate-coenzyme A ligase PaaK-like adenylate-forming protein
VALVRAALPANRFLGARCARAGFADPRDLRTWGDFERLPLTTKSELVED